MFTLPISNDLRLRLPEENDAEAMLALFGNGRKYFTYWSDWPNGHDCVLTPCRGVASEAIIIRFGISLSKEKETIAWEL